MMSSSKKPYIVIVKILFLLLPKITCAIAAPSATTATHQTIDVTVEGATIIEGSATAITRTFSTAVSTQPGVNQSNPQSPSAHSASSTMSVAVPNTSSDTLIKLITDGTTKADSITTEPLFARSYGFGQAISANLLSAGSNRTLNFNWKFENYQIINNPAVSFSEITNTVQVTTQSAYKDADTGQIVLFGEKSSGQLNHTSSIENDHLVSSFFNSAFQTSSLSIQPEINIALDLSNYNSNDLLWIEIEHIQTQYSIEAPAVATNQVEEKAGYNADDETIKLSWDTDQKELSFSQIPIDILNGNDSNSLQNKYINDPLNGGYIDIDPLVYSEADGYFEGNEIKLVDKDGNILLTASLPTLAFDNDLYESNGFNLFAPILNILEVNPLESLWLQDYLDKGGIDSLLLNELFIGFDTEGFSWDNDFEAPVTAFLSYTGVPSAQVPEPMMLILLLIGIIAFKIHFTFMQKRWHG